MNKHFIIFILVIFLSEWIRAQTAVLPAAGDGSEENPYQIASIENLYWIAADSTNWQYNYIQMADINAAETSEWFDGKGWKPICDKISDPFDESPIGFTGTYNGNGHIIDSLFINRPLETMVGLFGGVDNDVKNLGVIHLNITAKTVVGGIAGSAAYVENCYSSGVVTAISNKGSAGGLIGSIGWGGYIGNCYSMAKVNGGLHAGGLAGYGDEGFMVINSYSRGKINSIISGGLVGSDGYELPRIVNCYFAGSIYGSEASGGILGFSNFDECNILGVIHSYWNIDSTNSLTNEYGRGKTTIELKDQLLFARSPWDSTIWFMDAGHNNGYPYLSWQNPGGTPLPEGNIKAPLAGDGTTENPFQIATLENLYWIVLDPIIIKPESHFNLVEDINAVRTRELGNGEGWLPIGCVTGNFTGIFNGNGHVIDSLFINRPFGNYQGLFGKIEGEIRNTGITNADIAGQSFVGSLCAKSSNNIKNCFSTGKVHGTGSGVGGLVGGGSDYSFEIENCYSRATVTGGNCVGGLIGSINGAIHWSDGSLVENCYSTGIVSGIDNVGGLIGTSVETIFRNSFWDYEKSGQIESAGGVGKSTIQMKSADTFSDAGWDTNIWLMDSLINDGYPYLSWQNPETVIGKEPDYPNTFYISQNYPNPFNPITKIDYYLPKTSLVLIKIYDILGREAAVLVKGVKQAGKYSIIYDGKNVSSGIYFYSITAGKFHEIKKMILMR